jgi:nucleoside triphosphate pyrophosphatase
VQLVLASGSPQRRAILERLGVRFVVRVPEVEEIERGEPAEAALENARRKAAGVDRAEGEVVLGCDTIVSLGGEIFGKPADERAARRTLEALSGATHEVLSGISLLAEGRERGAVARTEVSFRKISRELLEWYLARGEWRQRSGGYAIQGAGSALVTGVRGDVQNVVGLPVATLLDICPQLLG